MTHINQLGASRQVTMSFYFRNIDKGSVEALISYGVAKACEEEKETLHTAVNRFTNII